MKSAGNKTSPVKGPVAGVQPVPPKQYGCTPPLIGSHFAGILARVKPA